MSMIITLAQKCGAKNVKNFETNTKKFWCFPSKIWNSLKSWKTLFCILKLLPGNTYWSGRLSTVDLLVPDSLDWLLFYWKCDLLFYKQPISVRRLIVLSFPSLVFPASNNDCIQKKVFFFKSNHSKCFVMKNVIKTHLQLMYHKVLVKVDDNCTLIVGNQ